MAQQMTQKKRDTGNVSKVRLIMSLWSDTRKKLYRKLLEEDFSFQQVAECLLTGYIQNDPGIMSCIERNTRKKSVAGAKIHRKYFGLDNDDAYAILDQIEKNSPLQDKNLSKETK